jgi:hypothetical protein
MEEEDLRSFMSSVGGRAVNSQDVEDGLVARFAGASMSGVSTAASDSAIAELCKRTRHAIAAAKAQDPVDVPQLDHLRLKLQMLLQLQAARSSLQTPSAAPSNAMESVFSVDERVRRGELTPQEALSLRASAKVEDASPSPRRRKRQQVRGRDAIAVEEEPQEDVVENEEGDGAVEEEEAVAVESEEEDADGRAGVRVGRWEADVSGACIVDDTSDESYRFRLEEWLDSNPGPDVPVGSGGTLSLPASLASKLFPYQLTGLRWLWELHRQRVGGIVADEMGLGKTAQMACFLGALRHSRLMQCASHADSAFSVAAASSSTPVASALPGQQPAAWRPRYTSVEACLEAAPTHPSLIVCPATLLAHWFRELAVWYPPMRVLVLHESGFGRSRLGRSFFDLAKRARADRFDVVLTSYSGLRQHRDLLVGTGVASGHRWSYVVLDEGHTIRNPAADVTTVAKSLRSAHRIVLSGSPVQNSLKELWSIMDFVFPGKLGDASTFETTFAAPIAAGGWSSASPAAQAVAYERATVLRDIVRPYLLQRKKRDVAHQLPSKSDQVLFCPLTAVQRRCYEAYLDSEDVAAVLGGNAIAFKALSVLRSICNHPWLVAGGRMHLTPGEDDDDAEEAVSRDRLLERGVVDRSIQRLASLEPSLFAPTPRWQDSGKLCVMIGLLSRWLKRGHRCLLFCQGLRFLSVIEDICRKRDWSYLRMDGKTPVRKRQALVDRFNSDASIFAFIMTTRTGGVGLNLTGADRVMILDPDWNPSTDAQAQERSWRVGQTRSVVVYRLITQGTLEEKVYHRQIFKTILQKRVFQDAKQKARAQSSGLHDLFTLDPPPVEAVVRKESRKSERLSNDGDSLVGELLGAAAKSAGATDADEAARAIQDAATGVDVSFRMEARRAARAAAATLKHQVTPRRAKRQRPPSPPRARSALAQPTASRGHAWCFRDLPAPIARADRPGHRVLAGWGVDMSTALLQDAERDLPRPAKAAHFAGSVAGILAVSPDSHVPPHSSSLIQRLRALQLSDPS